MKGEIRNRAETYGIVKSRNYSKQHPKFILDYLKTFGDGWFEVCIDCVDKTNLKNTGAADFNTKNVSTFIHNQYVREGGLPNGTNNDSR